MAYACIADPGTSSGSTTMTATWQSWNAAYFTSTTIPVNYLYVSSATTTMYVPAWGAWNTAYEETREQREVRERCEAAARQRAEDLRRAREAASNRAEELLLSLLTEEQAASYRERGWFEVRGSRGGRWRIRNRGQAGNVDLMPEIGEEREATYCAHPPDGLPDADAHVAQMLALVTNEEEFLRVANCRYRRPESRAA
jgi:hypothetical protein